MTMLRNLRIRLGVWLIRPYVRHLIAHYDEEGSTERYRDNRTKARNCVYIALGLRYAISPEFLIGTDYLNDQLAGRSRPGR